MKISLCQLFPLNGCSTPSAFLAIKSLCFLAFAIASSGLLGQTSKKHPRAIPPKFEGPNYDQIFFPDIGSAVVGEPPQVTPSDISRMASGDSGPSGSPAVLPDREGTESGSETGSDSPVSGEFWKPLVSADSLEDLVKQSKQRLDRAITNPAAFSGGGFRDARREFSLLALLLAIIEVYPEQVRWQSSAAAARSAMVRVSDNIKGGARSAFEEARRRQQDLDDLLSGSGWPDEPATEIVWENLIDIVPLMQVLEWAYQENVVPASATEQEFSRSQDELLRFAELIRVLAQVATLDNMPYADDDIFRELAEEMSQQAEQIRSAVSLDQWEAGRSASGQIGQACATCHESYR